MERYVRIELTISTWKDDVLPLNQYRIMGAGSRLELLTKVYETSMLPLQYPAYGSPGRSRTYDPMINSHLSPRLDCW